MLRTSDKMPLHCFHGSILKSSRHWYRTKWVSCILQPDAQVHEDQNRVCTPHWHIQKLYGDENSTSNPNVQYWLDLLTKRPTSTQILQLRPPTSDAQWLSPAFAWGKKLRSPCTPRPEGHPQSNTSLTGVGSTVQDSSKDGLQSLYYLT